MTHDEDEQEMTLPRALELVIEASRHCPICEVEDFDGQAIDICSDNYRVMSNAPELLNALENLWKFCIPDDQTIVGRIHLKEAELMIAKAKGE